MSDDLLFTVSDTARIAHEVTGDDAFTVASGSISIYDTAGALVVDAEDLSADPDFGTPAAEHTFFYAWTPDTSGDFRYVLRYVVGAETRSVRGTATVWPEFSLLDNYVQPIRDLIQDTEVGEVQRFLSLRDYQNAIRHALSAYAVQRPSVALSHTTDELADTDQVTSFCLWAAGWCMAYPLANKAAQTNEPQIEAQVVSYKTIRDQRFAQGMAMMKAAAAQWAVAVSEGRIRQPFSAMDERIFARNTEW